MPLTSRVYHINSQTRITNSGTDSSFDHTLVFDANEFDRCCVLQATIPNTFYTVTDGEYFILQERGVSASILVPGGCYNTSSFISVVQPLLTAASVTLGNNWVYSMTMAGRSTTQT